MLVIKDSPAGRFLDGLGYQLPWPKAAVVVSAHFGTIRPTLGGDPRPQTVHDFRGFPEPLFVALGDAGEAPQARTVHRSDQFGSLALDAFAFD